MSRFGFDERFFESTRGKIVKLLWESEKTVNDLAAELGLTDNAVRAHLLSLERDGVAEAGGTIKERGEFVPGEPYVFVSDPDGYEIEIWYEETSDDRKDQSPPRLG